MDAIRARITRLLQAVKTEAGLAVIEACIQEQLRAQYAASNSQVMPLIDPGQSRQIELQKAAVRSAAVNLDFGDPDELEDWEVAIEDCDSILDSLDDLPERAEDFADSVRDKTESIRKWIEEHEEVTGNQQKALQNMEEGVSRWLN